MKVGLIDFGEISNNSNGIETIYETINNAQLAESFGFSRYWLTEHYLRGVAWRNSELIINLIAGYTEKIKVGAAGVCLDFALPFRVAQDFTLLTNLFPNRIDLGFAKGGANIQEREELSKDINPSNFFERILKIKHFLDDKNEHLSVTPPNGLQPSMWLLGTSNNSTNFASKQGMYFSLSLFHSIDGNLPSPEIIKNFRNIFFKENGCLPESNIVVSAFCSKKESSIINEKKTRKNVRINVCGGPEECIEQILKLKELYNTDEIIFLNLAQDKEEKILLMETLNQIEIKCN